MNNKYISQLEIEKIRKWLLTIDLDDANITEVERQVYEALFKSVERSPWYPGNIAPLAEPGNITELVNAPINGVNTQIYEYAQRVDNSHNWLVDINNALKAELESVERSVGLASSSIQDISFVKGDELTEFEWISDSFNTSSFIDKSASTVLVDSNYGVVSLLPTQYEKITNFTVRLDNAANSKSFPGCNLLVLDIPDVGNVNNEPKVTLETTNSRDVANMLDNDPATWFEIERNYIYPEQRVIRKGRAFVADSTGKIEKVLGVTGNHDWKVQVQWPGDSNVQQSDDGSGRYIAEFVSLDSVNDMEIKPNPVINKDYNCTLVFDVIFNDPVEISAIRLSPYVRKGSSNISIVEIVATVDSLQQPLVLAKDTLLTTTNNSSTKIEKYIDRHTGSQERGVLLGVPTNRKVSKIRVHLEGKPYRTKLAHPFGEVQQERRSERRYGFFSSVDRETFWSRVPVFKNPPQLISRNVKTKTQGTTMPIGLDNVPTKGNVSTDGSHDGPFSFLSGTAKDSLKANAAYTSNPFAAIGLNIAGDLAASLLQFGSFSRTFTVLDQRVGYDIFDGFRSAVSLRDFSVEKVVYAEIGTLRTIKRRFARPVSRIGLFVEEDIPDEWGTGEWIQYFLSVDGVNWTPIKKLSDNQLESSYVPPNPTREIYLQAIFKRNPSDKHRTPQLKNYALKGLPLTI
jgi:hypothetical protein